MAPKRGSVQKAIAYVNKMGAVEEYREHRALIESIQSLIKKADVPMLRAVKSILEGKDKPVEGARLQRGVRQLGGSPTVAVPGYVVDNCLATLLKTSKTIVHSLSSDGRRHLFLYCLAGEEETLIPERKALLTDFEAWVVETAKENGDRLKCLMVEASMEIDWVHELGYFQLISRKQNTQNFDSTYCRLTGEIVGLPHSMTIAASDMPDSYEIANNWSLECAKLIDHTAGCEFALCKQFKNIDKADSTKWDPLSCEGLGEVMGDVGKDTSAGPQRVARKRPAESPHCSKGKGGKTDCNIVVVGTGDAQQTGASSVKSSASESVPDGSHNELAKDADEIAAAMQTAATASEGAPEVPPPPE